ncbi:MAG: histidine kinase dimerization/phospho-acceptor domain-containing protein [Syntrophobacteraceae bacterium]
MVVKLPIHLNIRQKIIAGFTLLVIIIGSVGAVSYHYLLEVERKQHFVEIADDLHNFILEARRHEKNFLLYNSAGDLEESRTYSRLGMELLQKISPEMKPFQGLPLLDQIRLELNRYRELIDLLAQRNAAGAIPVSTEAELREHGKALVDLSESLVSFERKRILHIVDSLKKQLLISLAMTIILGGLLVPVVSSKILRPLRVIEATTLQIAQGDFRTIPVRNTRDETQRVVEGFNRMISELEKRQEQLLQAKKLCSLGTLTSGIAHQLNNPLNNISTSCQILLEEFGKADGEFSLKMLTNIEGEVHRARDIVRGLLEFSRIEEFCLAPVPLSQIEELEKSEFDLVLTDLRMQPVDGTQIKTNLRGCRCNSSKARAAM